MTNRPDDAITGEVIAALGASPRVHAADVRVHTRRGWVRLKGIVSTLREREAAAEVAARVKGVSGVENDLVISPDRDVSDIRAAEEVSRLFGEDADITRVGVRVKAGTVFLMGKVPSLAVKERAVEVASGAKGVATAVSELGIAAGKPIDDVTLANDVAEAISDDPEIDVLELDVEAKDGSVLIRGHSPRRRHVDLISDTAARVPGVQWVENRVKVRGMAF